MYTVFPLAPSTRTVPAAPTGLASTVTAPAAADGATDAGATDAGAWLAGGADGDAPAELHPMRRAVVMSSDPTIRAFERMLQDLVADGASAAVADMGHTSASRSVVSAGRVHDPRLDGIASVEVMNHGSTSINQLALSATVHCLTGCAIGEVLGLVIATALGWDDLPSVLLAIVLAFTFGYALTIRPLIASGMAFRQAGRLAFASDTLSITTMEIVDTAIILAIPGAMAAGLIDPLFWGSLAFALAVAGLVAYPVNRWLIARGRGHAVLHDHHR
jgi:hypothetical protein